MAAMSSISTSISNLIVHSLTSLWKALKNLLFNAWVIFMMLGFWVVTPLAMVLMALVALLFYKIYHALISRPWKILRSLHIYLSQSAGETCNLLLHKPGILRLKAAIQQSAWCVLESNTADRVAIAVISAQTTLRDRAIRMLGWLGDSVISIMFYMPHGIWISLMTQAMATFMLGGGGTAYMLYGYCIGAVNETFGHDFLSAQQAKLEASQVAYLPLVSGYIRVLRILPGQFGTPLRCELKTVELSTARYEALSYVWGNPTMDRKIKVNGETLWIRRNLYHALSYLRNNHGARDLWVDALCINQQDLSERAEQVSQMRRIYSSAGRVIVWLGLTPFGIKQTFKIAHRSASASYHYGSVRVVSQLLTSTWWMRVWIVQELVLAKTAVVQCGHESVDWDLFCKLVDSIIPNRCFSTSGTYVEEYQSLKQERLSMPHTTDDSSQKKDLAGSLYAFRANLATDNRDKVFAFLGLLEDREGRIQQTRETALICVDYTVEPEVIFRDCAVKLINASGSLAMVALAECVEKTYFRGESVTSSTWFPQWSSWGNRFRAVPFWTGSRKEDRNRQPWTDLPFSAAGGVPAPPCKAVGKTLKVSGWVADEVAVVGQRSDISMMDFVELFANNPNTTLAPILELLVAARNWTTMLPQWKALAMQHHRDSSNAKDAERSFYKAITAGIYSDVEDHEAKHENLMHVIEAACYGRRFFITTGGRFGLGPSSVAAGDKVTILLGCDVPIILRRVSGEDYRGDRDGIDRDNSNMNIGQAYIDELMTYPGDLDRMIEDGKQIIDHFYLV